MGGEPLTTQKSRGGFLKRIEGILSPCAWAVGKTGGCLFYKRKPRKRGFRPFEFDEGELGWKGKALPGKRVRQNWKGNPG